MEEQESRIAGLKSPRLRSRDDRSTPTAIDLEATGPRKRDRDSQFGPTTPGADETSTSGPSERAGTASHAAKKGRIVSRDGSLLDISATSGTSFAPRPDDDQDPDYTPPGTPKATSIPASPAVGAFTDSEANNFKSGASGFAEDGKDTPPDTPLLNHDEGNASRPMKPEASRVKEVRERVQDMTTDESEGARASLPSAAPSPPAEETLEEIAELPASAAEAERNGDLHHNEGDIVIDDVSAPQALSENTSLPQVELPPQAPVTASAISAIQNAPRFIPPPSPASSVRAETGSNAGDSDYLDNGSVSRHSASRMTSVSSMRSLAGSSSLTTPHLHLHSALPKSSSTTGLETPSDALSDISTETNPPATPRPISEVDTPILAPLATKVGSSMSSIELSAPPSPAAPVLNAQGATAGNPLVQANFGRPTSSYAPATSTPPATLSSDSSSKPFVNPFSSFGSANASPFASSTKSAFSSLPSTSSNLSTTRPLSAFGGSSDASPFAGTTSTGKSAFDSGSDVVGTTRKEDKPADEALTAKERRLDSPQEVHMLTGEEDEFTQYQIPRAKLFVLEGTDWKERGVGQLRLNTKTSLADDKMSARMVMRSEAVHRLILNISLFAEMNVTLAQDKFLRFSAFEDGKLHHFTVRCANPVIGTELYEHVEELKHMLPKTMSSQEKASADKTDRPVQDA